MNSLPFAHLNLRRNPFGELTADERTELALVNISDAVQHLTKPRSVVQFIGEKGFGKTTHLLALAGRFAEHVYVHIPEGPRTAIPDAGEPLLIDEAQRLTLPQRWQVFRSDRRLILGTHRDFTNAMRTEGRSILTLSADRFTDATHVCTIFNARIEAVRRADGPTPSVTPKTAALLFAKFGSDLRSIEHALYHIFQQLKDVSDV
ncbi:MAG TPA: hypothetical protein PLY87_01965 [Planctomycetaceae bacterium]|nr:hypothetical protein [Planctomycetaceae bacterium]